MKAADIKFGTDGWRGIVADDFTFDRVALVGSAIREFLIATSITDKPLLIGYDRRFGAEAYAAHLASHLAKSGLQVIVSAEACPTPVIAFGVQLLTAAGAIMLTASHNPYYYQGLKFIPHFAGPAMPETTDQITAFIEQLAQKFVPPPLDLQWKGESIQLKDHYFEHLDEVVNSHSLSTTTQGVLYNAMHGCGAGVLDAYLLRTGVKTSTLNTERDVYFGGTLPDPSPANLQPLTSKLAEKNCSILIGTDGDADRFGIVDAAGRYYGANDALPLLADYLIRYKQLSGELIRAVSTSHLLDAVAKEQGMPLVETPVGFKYVGDRLRHGGLIGGEESGGVSVQGHIPEKDGILTALLMLELIATTGEELGTLLNKLHQRLGPRAFIRIDQALTDKAKQQLMAALKDFDKTHFAGRKIIGRNDIDGVKLLFEDDSWVLMRPSGTEPVVRTYIEVTTPETLGRFKAQVLDAAKSLIA